MCFVRFSRFLGSGVDFSFGYFDEAHVESCRCGQVKGEWISHTPTDGANEPLNLPDHTFLIHGTV